MHTKKQFTKPTRKPAYCYCTECDHQSILQQQQAKPLPFEQAMRLYCECGDRCGACLYPLEQLFRREGCYVEGD